MLTELSHCYSMIDTFDCFISITRLVGLVHTVMATDFVNSQCGCPQHCQSVLKPYIKMFDMSNLGHHGDSVMMKDVQILTLQSFLYVKHTRCGACVNGPFLTSTLIGNLQARTCNTTSLREREANGLEA